MRVNKSVTYDFQNTATALESFNIDLGANAIHIVENITVVPRANVTELNLGFSNVTTGGPVEYFTKNIPAGGPLIANTIYTLVNQSSYVVTDKRYLRIEKNQAASTDTEIVVSYISIPTTNEVNNDFGSASGTLSGVGSQLMITGPGSPDTIKVKSLYVWDGSSGARDAIFSLLTPTFANPIPLGAVTLVADSYNSFPSSNFPIYLNETNEELYIDNNAAGDLNWYLSFVAIRDPEVP